jgi:hypothetical protein
MYKARKICYSVKRSQRCRITDFVDADPADFASPKEQKASRVIFLGSAEAPEGGEVPHALTPNVRSSGHRSLRERLRPTGLAACLSRLSAYDLATPIGATAINAASLRGCRSTLSRYAARKGTATC